jgi:CRP/FNR family transcriptional regulator, cyclic AMP receptor protein
VRQTRAVADLLQFASDLPLVTVPAGEVLIGEGDPPTRMYVLEQGTLTIERDGVAFARVDHPGAILGEMSVLLARPASATVRAATDSQVRVVADAEAFLTERPGAALAILRTTATRLDGLTQYIVDVKEQFAGQEGHLGMFGDVLDTLVHHQAPPSRTGSLRDPEGDHQH